MTRVLGAFALVLCGLFIASGAAIADCTEACTGGGSGPCSGVGANVSISCGAERCLVTVKVNGNGGAGVQRQEVAVGSDTPVMACATGPSGTCCVSAMPCGGSTWNDAGSDCGSLCSGCDATPN